jgi:hypothetical protein
MFSALLIGQEGWYSKRCKLTWKLKGTKYNRMYFQLVPSTLPIEGTEFGLWLSTPRANEIPRSEEFAKGRTMSPSEYAKKMGMLPTPTAIQREHPERVQALQETGATSMFSRANGEARPNSILDHLQFHGMLPTPIAGDWKGQLRSDGTANMLSGKMALLQKEGLLPTPRANKVNGLNLENNPKLALRNKGNLEEIIAKALLPTPVKSDFQVRNPSENWEGSDLPSVMSREFGRNSQLNPQFVMEMMGFPPDWTLLPFLSGDKSQSRAVETP